MVKSKSHISDRRKVSSKLIRPIGIRLGCCLKLDDDNRIETYRKLVSESSRFRPAMIIDRLGVIANKTVVSIDR